MSVKALRGFQHGPRLVRRNEIVRNLTDRDRSGLMRRGLVAEIEDKKKARRPAKAGKGTAPAVSKSGKGTSPGSADPLGGRRPGGRTGATKQPSSLPAARLPLDPAPRK